MEERTDLFRIFRHTANQSGNDGAGFRGTEPQPVVAGDFQQTFDQAHKIRPATLVVADIDTGKHDFLEPGSNQLFEVCQRFFQIPGAFFAACVGHNAVRTEVFAALLHFQDGTGLERKIGFRLFAENESIFRHLFRLRIVRVKICQIPGENVLDLFFLFIGKDKIALIQFVQFLAIDHRRTTGHHDEGLGIFAPDRLQRLPRFLRCHGSDRAGVDNDQIGA